MCALALALFSVQVVPGQSLGSIDRGRGHLMLKFIKEDLERNYFDLHFHGLNIDRRFQEADAQIDSAGTLGQMFWDIGQVLMDLNDSHTMFIPPLRTFRVQYGWDMMMVGDTCMVTAVEPGSDAAAQGLKPGTIIGAINRIVPTRSTLSYIEYVIYSLMPQSTVQVTVLGTDGAWHDLTIAAKIIRTSQIVDLTRQRDDFDYWDILRRLERSNYLLRQKLEAYDDQLVIWKMPEFNFSDQELEELMDKVLGKKFLILDLRDNPGGYVTTLRALVGYFFDHDVTVYYTKSRARRDSVVAHHASHPFTGGLVVLVNSQSASSAEVFARTMQLNRRGTVIGDMTEGKVMEAKFFKRTMGFSTLVVYGTNITIASVMMPDGFLLERVGVMPDERMLPTSADLEHDRDPALARAARLAGVSLSPEEAGALFPIEWTQ